MSVTEVKQALGQWNLNLRPDTPRAILDQIKPFGHVAFIPGDVDIATIGDNALRQARYVGVYRHRGGSAEQTNLSGSGMSFWLGDEDDKGAVILSNLTFTASTFANTIRALLPPSVSEGTLYSASGTYTGSHQYQTPRQAITYVTDTFSSASNPVSWRVNGDGSIDAGPESNLFVTTPKAILIRKGLGRDMSIVGYDGQMMLEEDVEDYTTRVVLLAEGEGSSTVTASASAATSYKDIRGNLVNMTRLVSEFETDTTNAQARAQLQLNRFTNPRYAVDLSSDDYDVRGDFAVGDTIYVFDPDIGFFDSTKEVYYKGVPLNPRALKVSELTWPVPPNWTVAYRTQDGVWIDLSPYYKGEGGSTTIKVGEFNNSLTSVNSQPVGSRPIGDSSIPAAPSWGPFTTGSYLASTNGSGDVSAQIQPTWTQPLNTDGSTILDGDHYEIQYHPTSASAAPWDSNVVQWGATSAMITGLVTGTNYDFRIRAVDAAIPPNVSAWSATFTQLSSVDAIAPSTPAAPTVASSLIAVQVSHTLGVSGGGTYNLEFDLDHLEVHTGASATFTPDNTTRIGKIVANSGNLRGSIPAVGTFQISNTLPVWVKVIAVDTSGNKSNASTGASATATLIDTAHISDLSVSKVTAGTISSTWLIGGTIATASTGARAQMDQFGFRTFDASANETFTASANGTVQMIGQLASGLTGQRIVINPTGVVRPEMRLYPSASAGSTPGLIYADAYAPLGGGSVGASLVAESTSASSTLSRIALSPGFARYGVFNASGAFNGGGYYADTSQVQLGSYVADSPRATVGAFTASNIGGVKLLAKNASAVDIASLDLYSSGTGGALLLSAKNSAGTGRAELLLDTTENIFLTGKFINNGATSNSTGDAIICGLTSIAVGASSVTNNYGVNSAGTIRMVATCRQSTYIAWRLTTVNNTGMVMTLSSAVASGQSCDVHFWGFRTT